MSRWDDEAGNQIHTVNFSITHFHTRTNKYQFLLKFAFPIGSYYIHVASKSLARTDHNPAPLSGIREYYSSTIHRWRQKLINFKNFQLMIP